MKSQIIKQRLHPLAFTLILFGCLTPATTFKTGIEAEYTAFNTTTIDLKWRNNNTTEVTGYDIYINKIKKNTTPLPKEQTTYKATDLTANTLYHFEIHAIHTNKKTIKSNKVSAYTSKTLTGDPFIKNPKIPFNKIALNMENLGFALSDPDYYYWCISPIQAEEGKIHLFTARWPVASNMEGWYRTGELVHFIGDTPTGPFIEQKVILNNETLPKGQKSIHNIRVEKFGDTYCLLYIVQTTGDSKVGQQIGMLTSKNLNGPWELAGDTTDPGRSGIIIKKEMSSDPIIRKSLNGTVNPDIIQMKNGKYCIYFKVNNKGNSTFTYALSDNLTGPYTFGNKYVTNNEQSIEDIEAFTYNDKYYLLSTDNHGSVSGKAGYCVLWESEDGFTFKKSDATIAVGKFDDYITIPKKSSYPYTKSMKYERPSLLFINGEPKYFYAPSGTNILGNKGTQSFVMKIKKFSTQ